jgi:sortase (surface protein transpeptidase)
VAGKTLAVCALGLALVAAAGCAPAPRTPAPPVDVQAPAAAAPALLERLAPGRIVIPDLELDRPLVTLGVTDTGEHEVPEGALDVGWYRGGPAPGEDGGAVILGHVNWAGQAGSFARLAQLLPGDIVRVDAHTFEVYDVQMTPKDQFPANRVYGRTDGPELRLITCGGDLDATGHNYLDNVIVYAREAPPAPAGR